MQAPATGQVFPKQTVARLGGGTLELGAPQGDHDWQMIVIYRGLHCPLCKKYLATLQEVAPQLSANGIDVVVASGDPEAKASAFAEEVGVTLPMGYDLSTDQMCALGLYISHPRSAQEADRPFPEPGLFLVNEAGALQLVDISNAPFARPDLAALAGGLDWIRANDYPIRGTWPD